MRTNCSRGVIVSFECGLGLKIKISVTRFDYSTIYPTRSKFKLDKGTKLDVLKFATRRTSI